MSKALMLEIINIRELDAVTGGASPSPSTKDPRAGAIGAYSDSVDANGNVNGDPNNGSSTAVPKAKSPLAGALGSYFDSVDANGNVSGGPSKTGHPPGA
jgi:hypothetical protein